MTMGQRSGRYLATVMLAALGLAACGGDEALDAGAAPSSARAGDTAAPDERPVDVTPELPRPTRTTTPAAPAVPASETGGTTSTSGSEVTTTTAPDTEAPSTTTTTQCIDVGTFQGCPTHGGPAPGSVEDCNSTEPRGPCDPGVVLWNSSTHASPEYGEVDRAEPGQEITVVAVRFPAGSTVAFCFGPANAGCLCYGERQADSGGTASFKFLVPDDAAGEYSVGVSVVADSADEEIRATSEVLQVEPLMP